MILYDIRTNETYKTWRISGTFNLHRNYNLPGMFVFKTKNLRTSDVLYYYKEGNLKKNVLPKTK